MTVGLMLDGLPLLWHCHVHCPHCFLFIREDFLWITGTQNRRPLPLHISLYSDAEADEWAIVVFSSTFMPFWRNSWVMEACGGNKKLEWNRCRWPNGQWTKIQMCTQNYCSVIMSDPSRRCMQILISTGKSWLIPFPSTEISGVHVYMLPGVFIQASHKTLYHLFLCLLCKDRQISEYDLDCGFSLNRV